MTIRSAIACATFQLGTLLCAQHAFAETTNCANITSIPTVITTQGVHCLKQDVATSAGNVVAIDIRASNVTIDCNDHKIGGLAAGPSSDSVGIYAYNRANITIRNCNIRGFRSGIAIYGDGGPDNGTGHLVEDNRLERNTTGGITVIGNGSVVQRNRVVDTGGRPGYDRGSAISVLGDVIDNVVDGVRPASDAVNFLAEGIYAGGFGGQPGTGLIVRGNRVRNLVGKGTYEAWGIGVAGQGIVLRDNVIAQDAPTTGKGVYCSLQATLYGNRILNYSQPMPFCYDAGGNVTF